MTQIECGQKLHKTDLIKTKNDLLKAGYNFPIKLDLTKEIISDHGVIEVTHAPTGCMLIKRNVIEKMIEKHPELKIYQPTIINGKETRKRKFLQFI